MVPRFILRGCPKCHGDLGHEDTEKGRDGKFVIVYACVQCGKVVRKTARRVSE